MADTIVDNYLGSYSLKLNPQFVMEEHIQRDGFWEKHVLECIKYFIKPGHVCVDVGANAGYHTIAMAHYAGESGQVYAFEPNGLIFPRLVDNINLNQSLRSTVTCEKLGLSESPGQLKLFQAGKADGNAYMSAEYNPELWNAGSAEEYELCVVTTLDSYMAELPVNFLKIDVEGMELEVLRGAKQLLCRDHPIVVYESLVKCFDNKKIQQVEELLRSIGYLTFYLHPECGKLVPARYPKLPEDCIALPEAAVMKYAEVQLNAAQFELSSCKEAVTNWQQLVVTIVGYDAEKMYVSCRVDGAQDDAVYSARARRDCLEFTAVLRGQEVTFSLNLFQDASSGFHLVRQQFDGTISADGSSSQISGVQTGGNFFRPEPVAHGPEPVVQEPAESAPTSAANLLL